MSRPLVVLLWVLPVLAYAAPAAAQFSSLGTIQWQLQPYCNVVTVAVTQNGGVYTLDGFDDQCGTGARAPLVGVATPNPDGSVGFGMHLVTAPGGRGVQIEARVPLAGLTGPWTDSEGNSGTFAFDKRTGGNPRPAAPAAPVIPAPFNLQTDGGFSASGRLDTGTIPATGPGVRMMWHPRKAAFRAGGVGTNEWDEAEVGAYSSALGASVKASGFAAFATGFLSSASGQSSAAFGYSSRASGSTSFAAGTGAVADGKGSVAIGGEITAQGGVRGVLAGGDSAIAIGAGHDAAGRGSLVLGSGATTTVNAVGTFIFADRSTVTQFQSFFPNEFKVRAAGGTFFYSNSSLSSGVQLAPNANAWSSLSDVHSKRHFRDLDGEVVLARLAGMPIREWSYKAQHAAIRHVGPTAQDFHAAFGLGEDPRRISTIDADGVALRAVQALEARERLSGEALARENETLKAELADLRGRLDRLEAAAVDSRVAR
jgi:hypothetical protein